jgi:hypothetical protein
MSWIAIGLGGWLLAGYWTARVFGMAAKGALFNSDEEIDPVDGPEPGSVPVEESTRLSDLGRPSEAISGPQQYQRLSTNRND